MPYCNWHGYVVGGGGGDTRMVFTSFPVCIYTPLACVPGMYRSEFDLSCQLCPQNSESVYAASVECLCLDGYFRTPTEGAHSPCTG